MWLAGWLPDFQCLPLFGWAVVAGGCQPVAGWTGLAGLAWLAACSYNVDVAS